MEYVRRFGVWLALHLGLRQWVITASLYSILIVLAAIISTLVLSRLVESRLREPEKRYVANKLIKYGIKFTAFLLLVKVWFRVEGGLWAYLGLLSAGLAVALQDPVANFAGWIYLVLSRPYSIGDRIEIGELAGDVVDIRINTTSLLEIRNWVHADQSTGRVIQIPNSWVFKKAIANYNAGFDFVWNEMEVTITFESNWRKAREILSEILYRQESLSAAKAREELLKASREYMIRYGQLDPIVWTRVDASGVTLIMRYLSRPRERRVEESALWEKILDAFAAEADIDFAYPTQRAFINPVEGKEAIRAAIPRVS